MAAAATITAGAHFPTEAEMMREDEGFLDSMQRLGYLIGGCVILVIVLLLERAPAGMLCRAHASLFCVGLRCRQRFDPGLRRA
eukprot:1042391-Prymnesium_polylepis.1